MSTKTLVKVGKLYSCEEWYLMLYPDQEAAFAAAAALGSAHAQRRGPPSTAAAFWSNQLGKPVFYTEKNIPILVLNSKEKFYEVLAGDRKGWIIVEDWLELKEIV